MKKEEMQKMTHQDIWRLLHAVSNVLENNETDKLLIGKDIIGHILSSLTEVLGTLTDEVYNHLSEFKEKPDIYRGVEETTI